MAPNVQFCERCLRLNLKIIYKLLFEIETLKTMKDLLRRSNNAFQNNKQYLLRVYKNKM